MKNLYSISPEKGDVIVHTFPSTIPLDEVYKVQSKLIHLFPNNHVIAVPDTETIHKLDGDSTIEMLQAMIDILKENQGNA